MIRRRRSSGWKWVVLAALGTAAAFYFSRGLFQGFQKTYPPNAFYQVKRADMLISIAEEGALRALNETVVRCSLEGLNRVIHLVPEGSYVQKGDLLVELDSAGLRDRLNEQELIYQERLFQTLQATGNLKIQKSLAESQIKDAELKAENAQSDLEKYRDGDAPLLIKTVEARSGVLAEQVRIASERYARTQELFKTGNATKSELEADALTLKREQLALGQYQEDLRLIKKYDQPNQVRLLQSNVDQAKAELARLRQRTSNEIAQAEADLKTSQAALQVLEEDLQTQRRRLENAKIFAPQSGLVVYASVSPFQFAGDREDRRRGGRGGGRGGGEAGSGEFRGGGRRGGRSGLESSSGGGSSSRTTAETAPGNQRIASAVSGSSSITEPNAAGARQDGSGTSTGGAGTGGASPGGGRSGGGAGGSGGSGGQNVSSPVGAFASYPSMRPSSAFGGSGAATNQAGAGSTAATSSSSASNSLPGGQSSFGIANQFAARLSAQSFGDFGGFDFYGTPGILEEGTMVRQRQELIRLPDVSKMLAEVKIPESRVRQVRAGMTAYIQVNNIPHRRFKGTVRRVALLPDAQSRWMNPNLKVFPTDILVEEELPLLKPGVSASAEIIITNLSKVLSVPIQTVARLRGESVCFVKRGSRVTPVPVTTGWYNDAFVEITSGLKEGDFVLLAPVSDEGIEDTQTAETNNVEAAGETIQRPTQGIGEPPAEERRFQRRNEDSPNGGAPPERRRDRQGSGRRPQSSQDAPE
ncbi:MAG: efflux RND transporter periplasmic adaptor subunit [Verrucomicrobia subdivision 3 bacterium]|nr:efflux RND transporter periplasmic adaptor subunit [Limisphaerales bacterium]